MDTVGVLGNMGRLATTMTAKPGEQQHVRSNLRARPNRLLIALRYRS